MLSFHVFFLNFFSVVLVLGFLRLTADLLCRQQGAELCIRKALCITYVLKCLVHPTFSSCIPVRHKLRKQENLVQSLSLRPKRFRYFISSLRKTSLPTWLEDTEQQSALTIVCNPPQTRQFKMHSSKEWASLLRLVYSEVFSLMLIWCSQRPLLHGLFCSEKPEIAC